MKTHLDGRTQLCPALPEHIGQVLARMLATGEVQSNLLSLPCGYDTAGEDACAFVGPFAGQPQHSHPGVIIVQHFALRSLPDQLLQRRLHHFRRFFDDFPLRRSGQWNAQARGQLF